MSAINFPSDWVACSISDVAQVNPKKLDAEPDTISGFVPMALAPVSFSDSLRYEEKHWKEIKKSYTNFQNGDVIFAKVTPCFENGKAAIVDGLPNGIGAGSSEFYVLRPHTPYVLPEILFALIKTQKFANDGAANMTGAVGLRRVPRAFVESFDIPMIPIAEQKVIAEKLDTLLAQVEATKTRLESALETLKQFRQSVLAAAVSGKLTEDWRDSSLPQWQKVKLIDVLESKPRNGKSPKGVDYETPYRNLTLSSTTTGKFIENQYKFVELDIDSDSYLWVKNGDILIQRANTIDYVGVSAIYEGEDDKYVYPDLIMKCRSNESTLGKYIHLALSSEKVRKYFRDNATGTAGNMPKINQQVVSNAPISLPTLAEQHEIVSRVARLFASADATEQQVNQALERVNNLTKSILAKAFRGELTEQWRKENPELISGENSAEALLKKIKAERAAAKPKRKARATSS